MATEIGENTKITLDLKTIAVVIVGAVSIASTYFALQAQIEEAKLLPEPNISRTEYDLKDELIRQTILDTQDDVQEMKEQLNKIDQRLYELQQEK